MGKEWEGGWERVTRVVGRWWESLGNRFAVAWVRVRCV